MDYDFKKIGKRIRSLRVKHGWTQQDLINELDKHNYPIGRNTISNLEQGKFTSENFNIKLLLTLCKLFECETGYLLCEYDFQTKSDYIINEDLALSDKSINILKKYKNTFIEMSAHLLPSNKNKVTFTRSLNYILEEHPYIISYLGNILLSNEMWYNSQEDILNFAMQIDNINRHNSTSLITNEQRYSFAIEFIQRRLLYLENNSLK